MLAFGKLPRAAAALAAAALAVPIAGECRADPLTAQDVLSQFNAVVTDSFTSNSDVEGRLVTGAMTGGASFWMPRGTASPYARSTSQARISAARSGS